MHAQANAPSGGRRNRRGETGREREIGEEARRPGLLPLSPRTAEGSSSAGAEFAVERTRIRTTKKYSKHTRLCPGTATAPGQSSRRVAAASCSPGARFVAVAPRVPKVDPKGAWARHRVLLKSRLASGRGLCRSRRPHGNQPHAVSFQCPSHNREPR